VDYTKTPRRELINNGVPIIHSMDERKRNPQVNFSCSQEMYEALTWLAKKMKYKGRPDVVRWLIAEPLSKKLDEYGFKSKIPERDNPK